MTVLAGCITYKVAEVQVFDAETEEPVAGASVLLSHHWRFFMWNSDLMIPEQCGFTGDYGTWSFVAPSVGHDLIVRASGYATYERRLERQRFKDGTEVVWLVRGVNAESARSDDL